MNKTVDPGTFGLPLGTKLALTATDTYVLTIEEPCSKLQGIFDRKDF